MRPASPFPDQLATDRIGLRRYRVADAPRVLRLIEQNRDRLLRSFPELANGVTNVEEAAAYLDASHDQWRSGIAFVYGIWIASEAAPIGQLRVKNIVWNVPAAELSYFVDRACLRRGVATDAIRAVLREAFDAHGFKRLYVRIISSNEESLALARRLKLRHEGVHRNAFRCGFGELHDVHLFAMTDVDHRCALAG